MPKTKISEFDVDPANNTDINSINIAEGCAPSGINNAIRQLMSDLKEFQTGAAGDSFTVGGAFAANGGATLGDASGDALTINSSAVSIPNGLNFDSNTFVIDAGNNNVGIGTASPQNNSTFTTLTVDGTNSIIEMRRSGSRAGRFYVDSTGTTVGAYTATPLMFITNDTERMRIDSSGNVGIGTSSPTTWNSAGFAVRKNSSAFVGDSGSSVKLELYNNGNTSSQITFGQGFDSGSDGVGFIYNRANAAFVFGTNNTERMRIDSSGNVAIGTTNASDSVTNGAVFTRTDNRGVYLNLATTATTSWGQINFKNGNGLVGSVSTVGTSTNYNTSSDYRLKENIAPMTGALATVASLKPVTYTWKADGSDGQGFIAHELAEVIPDCVTGEKDAVDSEGNPVYQGIDTSFLVATLTAAIQEQQAIITDLKARIETLENK